MDSRHRKPPQSANIHISRSRYATFANYDPVTGRATQLTEQEVIEADYEFDEEKFEKQKEGLRTSGKMPAPSPAVSIIRRSPIPTPAELKHQPSVLELHALQTKSNPRLQTQPGGLVSPREFSPRDSDCDSESAMSRRRMKLSAPNGDLYE